MCYCYRKLGNLLIFSEFMGGRGALIGWDSLTDLSEPIRGVWPPKFGLPSTRPPTFSHVICLSQSEESTASHAHGLRWPIGLSCTPGDAVLGQSSPISRGRPIGLSRPPTRPLTKSCDLSESLRWEAVGG